MLIQMGNVICMYYTRLHALSQHTCAHYHSYSSKISETLPTVAGLISEIGSDWRS